MWIVFLGHFAFSSNITMITMDVNDKAIISVVDDNNKKEGNKENLSSKQRSMIDKSAIDSVQTNIFLKKDESFFISVSKPKPASTTTVKTTNCQRKWAFLIILKRGR